MMKLVAFLALLAVAAARPAPGAIISYSAPVVHAAPIATTYTAIHAAAPVVATYAAVPATHSYVSGIALHAAPIEQHGYKIVY